MLWVNFDKNSSILTALTLLWSLIGENIAQKRASLGFPCLDDEVCSTILHSSCIENECQCRANTKRVNATCLLQIGGFCWKDEDCGIENSACINRICQCKESYLAVSEDQCSPMIIGSHCADKPSCKGVKFVECIDSSCRCSQNTRAINPAQCLPILGVCCQENSDCKSEHSACIDHSCQCSSDFVPYRSSKCVKPYLTMPCEEDRQCSKFFNHTTCYNDRCTCDNHSTMQGGRCLPNWNAKCFDGEVCGADNSECIDNKCQCKAGFIFRSKCLPLKLGAKCSDHLDCYEIKFAMCIANQCQCRGNFSRIGESCTPMLGEFCWKEINCAVAYSECIDNKCQCSKNYRRWGNKQCKRVELGNRCEQNSDCSLIPNAMCSTSKRCECGEYSFVINGTCWPVLRGICTADDQCYSDSLRCVNNTCQCKQNGIPSGHLCVQSRELFSCENPIECSDLWHVLCTISGKCTCHLNNIMVGHSTCLPLIDGKCWRNDQCRAQNSICVDFRCACKPKFVYVARNFCSPTID